MTKTQTEKLLAAIEHKCEQRLKGPTRSVEWYTAALREIRDMVREARK